MSMFLAKWSANLDAFRFANNPGISGEMGPPSPGQLIEELIETQNLLVIAVVILGVAVIAGILLAFYRRRSQPPVPGNLDSRAHGSLAAHLIALEGTVECAKTAVQSISQDLVGSQSEVRKVLERMIETYMALQPKLDERDKEILKLRNGYESALFRRFIRRFVRVDVSLNDRIRGGINTSETLTTLRTLLADALEECGVERFEPERGTDFRRAPGVANNPVIVPTQDHGNQYKIVDVVRSGYRFIQGDGDRIIVPAEVTVYSTTIATEGGS